MKQVNLIFALLIAVIWIGCGGGSTGPNGDDPPIVTRVVANTSVAEPTLSSPDESMWSSVTATTVNLDRSGPIAKPLPKAALVPASVSVKAIVKNSKLYMRFEWTDDSLHIWRDHWTLINNSSFNFTRNDIFNEDNFFAMFTKPGQDWYDTWNWRVLTTAPAGLAEGYTFSSGTLTRDAGSQILSIQNINPFDPNRPKWIHQDKSQFTGPILYKSQTFEPQDIGDFGAGWIPQMKVAGWIIDLSVLENLQQNPQSRWDITTASSYDADSDVYKLVMSRALNSGFDDDMNMAGEDSVQVRLGVLDDRDELSQYNSSQQGFSNSFWLILP